MNNTLFKIHSWLAVIFFLPLLVISVTGSILVFKPEIDGLLMPSKVELQHAEGERQSLDVLRTKVTEQFPEFELAAWEIFDDHITADVVYLVKYGTQDWYKAFLNPYSAVLLSDAKPMQSYITEWLLSLHFEFLVGTTGVMVTGVFSVVLFVIGLTGIILYRSFWKQFFTLRWKARAIIWNSDLHKMVGIVASPVLLVLSFTGAYWNVSIIIHELYEHTEEHESFVLTESIYNKTLSLQSLNEQSQQIVEGFTPTYLLLPFEPDVQITFYGKVPTNNFLLNQYSSMVSFDKNSGELLLSQDIRQTGFLQKFDASIRRLHFGTFAGLPTRIIWCVLGVTPLLLTLTGLYMWVKRRPQRRLAKQKALLKKQNKQKQEQLGKQAATDIP